MSEETNKKPKTTEMKRVLVFGGKTGWIGNLMCELIEKEGNPSEKKGKHITGNVGTEEGLTNFVIIFFPTLPHYFIHRGHGGLSCQFSIGRSRGSRRRIG
jgi:hypothetical protein